MSEHELETAEKERKREKERGEGEEQKRTSEGQERDVRLRSSLKKAYRNNIFSALEIAMHKKSIFAHRGYHASASRENTICAFKRAIHEVDGFECDVRLSLDGIPVIVHDATLRRTHGLAVAVNSLTASELEMLDIPSAFDVLALPNLHDKTIILDLKEHERMLCRRLGPAIDACAARVILLSYSNDRPTTRHVVYRAVNYNFTVHSAFDGIACKFNGSVDNMSSISRALRAGIKVNLFAQLQSDEAEMLKLYGVKCTYTVATTGLERGVRL
jgi:hypothetical protein